MALFAIAIPILPGKTQATRAFTKELMGARHAEFNASRKSIGARERTFFQSTPMGDMVIVTFEGDDPAAAMAKFGAGTDDFTNWFVGVVKEIHGVNLREPMAGALSELIADSE